MSSPPDVMTIVLDPEGDQTGIFGRSIAEFDRRSRKFPARGVLFGDNAPLKPKTWRRPAAYDQQSTSQCVSFTMLGLASTQPNTRLAPLKLRRFDPSEGYRWMQRNDEWDGEEPTYSGTSTLAGAKWLKERGAIGTYRWCFGADDVLRTLSHAGPVAIGIWWFDSMMATGPDGLLRVDTDYQPIGGHAVELHGIDLDTETVVGTNSWGVSWGQKGRFRLRWDDLDTLLRDNGEAMAAGW